jgi:hypothetical protein
MMTVILNQHFLIHVYGVSDYWDLVKDIHSFGGKGNSHSHFL